ncbi:MAG: hypothetical protein LWW81_10070 [Rhodocyclales bacterium]|nr:hypothetical protein [Rhodocyclales bacterium]
MPANPWAFDVDLGLSPDDALLRVLAVVREIASHDPGNWPPDEAWRRTLPTWLKHHLPELTKEETEHLMATTPRDQWDTLPWEFGSWIDAVRDRGWRWWGYRQSGASATLVLHIAMFPERIDAFKEILRAAGINIITERYAALNPS